MNKRISKKAFYFPAVILMSYFVYRIIDMGKMTKYFPLAITNDYITHLGQLYFLKEIGFHNMVPYWYNGYKLFLLYPPGWYYFTYPIYLLTNNVLVATFTSVIALFAIILISLFAFGKTQRFSKINTMAFFLLLFGNSIAIGNYIRLGRVTELFALTSLIVLACTILYYRKKEFDLKFFLIFLAAYTGLILGHPAVTIIGQFLLLSILLVKENKERIKLIAIALIAIIATWFWWYPFITGVNNELSRAGYEVAGRLLDFSGAWMLTSIASIIVGITFLVTFTFYMKTYKNKKEFLFFSPIALLCILFLTRMVVIIPVLKSVYPDVYMMFFLFFSAYFLLKSRYSKKITNMIAIGLIVMSIVSVTISEVHTSKFEKHGQEEKDMLEMLGKVSGKYYIVPTNFVKPHHSLYYAYGAIYYNLSSPGGVLPFGIKKSYIEGLDDFDRYMTEENCEKLKETMRKYSTEELITNEENCGFLRSCRMTEKEKVNNLCLFRLT